MIGMIDNLHKGVIAKNLCSFYSLFGQVRQEVSAASPFFLCNPSSIPEEQQPCLRFLYLLNCSISIINPKAANKKTNTIK
jgi:hypothetical protein